jgi:hypothetical protein
MISDYILSKDDCLNVKSYGVESYLTITRNNEGKLVVEKPFKLGRRAPLTTLAYLESMSDENECKAPLLRLYSDWRNRFETMPAGAKNHHSQVGGLDIHTAQVIEIALDMMEIRKAQTSSEVTRDDIIIASFLHDFSKVEMYRRLTNPDEIEKNGGREFKFDSKLDKLDAENWTLQKCLEYRVPLTVAHVNAIHYAEGGFSTWSKQKNQPKWSTLGVLISCADIYSASIIGK